MLARLDPELLDHLWFPLAEAAGKDAGARSARARPAGRDRRQARIAGPLLPRRHRRRATSSSAAGVHRGRGRDRRHATATRSAATTGTTASRSASAAASTSTRPNPLYVLRKDAANEPRDGRPEAARSTRRTIELDAVRAAPRPRSQVDAREAALPLAPAPRVPPATDCHDATSTTPFTGAAPGQTATLLRGDAVVGWGTIADPSDTVAVAPTPSRCLPMPDRIELTTPVGRAWDPVIRLVLGGIADRLDLGFDELDDLQLAVERLLAEARFEDRVTLDRSRSSSRACACASGRCSPAPSPTRSRGPPAEARRADARPDPPDGRRLLRGREGRGRPHGRAAREGRAARLMPGSPVNATLDDRELLRRYHEGGDASAREALVQRHLPLVRSLARRYAGPRRGARRHRAGRRDRPDQGDRPLRAVARGRAHHVRDARTSSARSSATSATRAGPSACRARCRS